MKKPVVFLHPSMEPYIVRMVANPNPQGEEALARAAYNGVDVVYLSEPLSITEFSFVQTSSAVYFTANTPRFALDQIYATKRRLGALDLFDDLPAHSLGMMRMPK